MLNHFRYNHEIIKKNYKQVGRILDLIEIELEMRIKTVSRTLCSWTINGCS